MNWGRALIAGIVGGIVMNFASFVVHGLILANTYTRFPVFTQEAANPLHFFLVSGAIGVASVFLFAKTRASWAPGAKGGLAFGLLLGLALFFRTFYNPLVLEGFPYFLSWCWGGSEVIVGAVYGVVVGAIYK